MFSKISYNDFWMLLRRKVLQRLIYVIPVSLIDFIGFAKFGGYIDSSMGI